MGTKFNHDFWKENIPRRSTYLSCQATIAARLQGKEKEMIHEIQQAYYMYAKNPSNENNYNINISFSNHKTISNEIKNYIKN